jgi:4-diphosphocytidyl-2-C-methyl-D-erythritol kinase
VPARCSGLAAGQRLHPGGGHSHPQVRSMGRRHGRRQFRCGHHLAGADLALRLGADIPFFIHGRNALVCGVGEHITPLALPPVRLAVVKPPQGLDTGAIFAHPLLRRDSPRLALPDVGTPQPGDSARAKLMGSFEHGAAPPEWLAHALRGPGVTPMSTGPGLDLMVDGFGHNDLQAAAQALCPEVEQACRWLESRWGNSRMTGSGSAVFARLDSSASARSQADAPALAPSPAGHLANSLGDLPPAWAGRLCCSLPRHPLWAWAS